MFNTEKLDYEQAKDFWQIETYKYSEILTESAKFNQKTFTKFIGTRGISAA